MQPQTSLQPSADSSSGPSPPFSRPQDVTLDLSPGTVALYEQLTRYPFESDHEYQVGLAAILGHPDTLATREEIEINEELVLQAQCFYYARKFGTELVQPPSYKIWLRHSLRTGNNNIESIQTEPTALNEISHDHEPTILQEAASATSTSNVDTAAGSQPEQPPYPSSFASIIDMIVQNKRIPGIEQVPDTVLEPGASKVDNTQRRRKPWESAQMSDVDDQEGRGNEQTLAGQRKEEGVLKILQPGAIPDSGLLSKE